MPSLICCSLLDRKFFPTIMGGEKMFRKSGGADLSEFESIKDNMV